MTDLVPADQIEKIVGATRHKTAHIGRLVSAEDTVYILHSHECRDSGIDLRECRFSRALDGRTSWWPIDEPVELSITNGELTCEEWIDGGGGE